MVPNLGDRAHEIIACVRDVERSEVIEPDSGWVAQSRIGWGTTIADGIDRGCTGCTTASDSRDDASTRNNLAHAIVQRVGHEKVSRAVEAHAATESKVDHRIGRRTTVTAISCIACTHHRCDDACRCDHLPDAIVTLVADVHVVKTINRNTTHLGEARQGCRATVAPVRDLAHRTRSCDVLDDSGSRNHFSNPQVVGVIDKDISFVIDSDAKRMREMGVGRQSAIAEVIGIKEGIAVARDRRDDARWRNTTIGVSHHFADAIVLRIGDVEVATIVGGKVSSVISPDIK